MIGNPNYGNYMLDKIQPNALSRDFLLTVNNIINNI